MSKKYVSVLKDSAATPGYRIIAPEDYVYTENGTKKVKKIDSKADKKVPATAGNLATLDSTGNLADSGKQTTDFMNALTTAYEASGSATKTVTKVTQAKTGAVAVTYSDIQSGTTSQKGLVQLEDSTSSTSVTKAATPNSVKSAYDLANGKYSKPSGGIPSTDMDSAVQASLGKADTAIQGVKLNGSTLTPSSAKVVDLGDLKTKQTAVSDPSASGTTITAIATISQNANGVITATKKTIQSASQSQDGVMSAADKKKLDGIATGAEVNQNAFSNVKVGDVTVAADTKTDTLTLAAGSNVTITPDATNDKITIAAKDTTYTADAGIRLDGTVFKHTNSVSGGTVGPTTDTAGATLSVPYVTYDSQGHVTASGTRTHNVGTASTSGAGIVQLQDSIDATTTKAATPNAVKKAIEALDVSSVGGSGKYISAISETDGKISATSTTMDTTPTASSENAVTSGGVKAALDGKINAGAAVIFGDAVYRRANESGNGWNKLAETTFTREHTNAFGFFDVYYGQLVNPVGQMSVNFNVRADAAGSKPSIKNASYFKVSGQDTYDICIVCRGLVGNVTVEIWGYLPTAYISMAVVFRAHTNAQDSWRFALSKSKWTFYNYSGTSTSKPVADTSTNVKVVDATGTIIQKAVASPVNNNLVAMDANGLVKDSGKKATDFVQSVKIGSGSELKDASGNVSIPVDSTPTASSNNLMTSGGIKTALDGKQNTLPTTGTASDTYAINVSGKAYQLRSIEVKSPQSDKCWAKIAETTNNTTTDYHIAFSVHNDGYAVKSAYIGILSVAIQQSGQGTAGRFAVYFYRADAVEFDAIKAVLVNTGTVLELWVCNKRASQYIYFTPLHSLRLLPVYGQDRVYTQDEFDAYISGKSYYPSVEKGVNRNGTGAVGSSSIPVWVDANGTLTQCTDDFVHDGDVTSTYSATGTAPVNGTAVASAISRKVTQFKLGSTGNSIVYTTFAKFDIANEYGHGEAQIILSSGGNYAGVDMGTWLITMSNRGSTAATPKASMTVRCLNQVSYDSYKPEFGYYYDTTNAKICFGVKSTAFRGNNTITILSTTGYPIEDFGDVTTAPSGWTAVTVTEYATTTHTHGNIANGGALQTNDITIANGDKLVVTDSSDSSKVARASISFDGSTTTQALTKAGTWATFNNYSLPLAASGTRGGIQIGYSESGTNYAVKLSSEKAYVTVPWTDTKQNITLATTTKAFITGVSTTPTGTAQALTGLADTGVYLTTTAGELNATQYKVNEHCTMKYNSTKSSLDFTFA